MSKSSDVIPRPRRADARRNIERLLQVASEIFSVQGIDASLDEIARKAGIGNATLYRHFPTRHALLVAVCVNEVEELCALGEELSKEREPADALEDWLRAFIMHVKTKRGLATALMTGRPEDSAIVSACHARLASVGSSLVARARKAKRIRASVRFDELFVLMNAVAVAVESADAERTNRILDVLLHGVRQ